jgi:hypothetical protein
MLRETIKPFTVSCVFAMLIACANFDERGGAADRPKAATAGHKTTISAPGERVIVKGRVVVTEKPHRTFDRVREEQYEEEEEHGGDQRHRHY